MIGQKAFLALVPAARYGKRISELNVTFLMSNCAFENYLINSIAMRMVTIQYVDVLVVRGLTP